jgi:triacylglycerol lipase
MLPSILQSVKHAHKLVLPAILALAVQTPLSFAVDIEEPHPPIGPRVNPAPIILMHGFTGWGRDEAFGFNYFGGLTDIQTHLRERDFITFTTAAGPFSSSWDRACEIFAQIKGGRVDYGQAHAEKHGHERFGRNYTGYYPEWGNIDKKTQKPLKIHLIGHSQGGLDSRIISQLLAKGDREEIKATPPNKISPFFTGGHNWILSVTTLSTPHDGTTLANNVARLLPKHQYLTAFIGATWSALGLPAYDWKLNQWGLERGKDEEFGEFTDRVTKSRFWRTSRDSAAWDVSPEGARENNRWVNAQPNVFYFSYSSQQTDESWFSDNHTPNMGMFSMFRPLSKWMGEYTQDSDNRVIIDEKWFPNDGIVNTISMDGPKISSTDKIIEYDKKPVLGAWNHMGNLNGWDHFDYLGMFNNNFADPRPFFGKLANYLGALPSSIRRSRTTPTPMIKSVVQPVDEITSTSTPIIKPVVQPVDEITSTSTDMATF